MSSHISHVRPSLFQRLLNKIGFLELPTRVNCWFCNQDSFILPGSKNTVGHWFCHLCENTNKIDKNGEISDPGHLEVERNAQSKPSTTKVTPSDTTQTICEDCSKNQVLIYEIMSSYLPDETDPTYEAKCATVDAENERLQKKYKLCDSCQALVDMVVSEKMEFLKVRNINRTFASSISEVKVPIRPSKRQYISQAIIYFIIHLYTFSVVIYKILYPSIWPAANIGDDFFSLINYLRLEGFSCFTVENVKEYALYIVKSAKQWNTSTFMIVSILLNCMSVITFDYHPKVDRFRYERVKNWQHYKRFQGLLFILRFILTAIIVRNCKDMLTAVFAGYISVFLLAYFTINVVGAVVKKEIGSFTKSFVEEPAEEIIDDDDSRSDVSMMDISVMDEPMSINNNIHTNNSNTDDPIDILTNRFNSL